MKMQQIFPPLLSLITLLTLTGCGGGGSGSSPTPSNQQQSSVSVDPCNNSGGTVFSECLNSYYGNLVGWTFSPALEISIDPKPTDHVQAAVVDSGDPVYKKVIEVSFTTNEKQGLFFIGADDQGSNKVGTSAPNRDLSAYATGTLSFDFRVTDFGEGFDKARNLMEIQFKPECVWPCAAHEQSLLVTSANTWMRVSVNMKDLVASGLNLKNINNILQLSPVSAKQKGIKIQLDNITLTKGTTAAPADKSIFREDFNIEKDSSWVATYELGKSNLSTFQNVGAYVFINWGSDGTFGALGANARWEKDLSSTINITDKTASYQIICYPEQDNRFTIEMIATDVNNNVASGGVAYGSDLVTPKTATPPYLWREVSLPLGHVFERGFDATKVKRIGLRFNSMMSSGFTSCRIDTIVIQ